MKKQALIDALYDDLAGELQAIIQYLTYSAKMTDPWRPQLVTFMQTEIQDELLHAQFLADKISRHWAVIQPPHQSRFHRLTMRMPCSKQSPRLNSKQAKPTPNAPNRLMRLGIRGLAVQLEDMMRDETGHAEETAKLLKNWD